MNQWFKFYGAEYLSDPKMLALSACERSCWITLLAYASQSNGIIKYLDEETLMSQAGINFQEEEWNFNKGILEKFVKMKMITIDNANDNIMITVINWRKRQETSQTGYERIKKYREKQRNDNAMITNDNECDNAMITVDKNRIDKNRIDKNKNIYIYFSHFLEELKKGEDFKKILLCFEKLGLRGEIKKDDTEEMKKQMAEKFLTEFDVWLTELKKEFSDKDLIRNAVAWSEYWEHPPAGKKKPANLKSSFRTWISKDFAIKKNIGNEIKNKYANVPVTKS